MTQPARCLLFLLALLPACSQGPGPGKPGVPPPKTGGVKLQTLDYDGIMKLIASHQGKIVVIDCWSTS